MSAVTGAGLHAGLLREAAGGLTELSGPGYARIPAADITEALQDGPATFRWPGAAGDWEPGPPTHVGIFTDAAAAEPRTAIALPEGAGDGTTLELPADALRRLLVGA